MRFFIIFLLFLFSYSKTINNSLRISFQNLHFQNENLGLLETSYLFNFSKFYSGIGIYSAITGKRGGFFTGGFLFGIKFPIKKLILDSGVFIGGGGGGHAPQGSGLMIKTHAGILIPINNFSYGININHINFKDGKINSTQLGFIIDYNYKDIYFTKKPKFLYGKYGIEDFSFSPFFLTYFPINSKNTQNKKQKIFSLLGVEIKKYYPKYFIFLSGAGAVQGKSDGYAEYIIGLGKKIKKLLLKAGIGAGGGGLVDTKGGFLYKIETETNFNNINAAIGFMNAPGGIKSLYTKLLYSKKIKLITTGNKLVTFKIKKLNTTFYLESYLPSKTVKKNQSLQRVDILNLNIGIYKNNNLFFLNAGSAVNGNSGGYAIGMFGIRHFYHNFFTSCSIGAAGGGNINVGGGLIAKIKAGYKYKHFILSIGRIKSLNGKLNTTTISIGYSFDFYKGYL